VVRLLRDVLVSPTLASPARAAEAMASG
jgi:hypothetical protein